MKKAEGASKEKRVVKLLLLYQGTKAEEFADDIITPLEKDWAGDIGCVCDALKFGEVHSQVDLYSEYTKKAAWADAAVAILAVDPRAASTVGNVWFEIGWWLAKKPYGTLLICAQDHPEVAVITDFEGRQAPRFSTPEKLIEGISKHVVHVASKKFARREAGAKRYDQCGHYLDASKLKDTLGCDKWDQQGVHTCEHLILRPAEASSDGDNESQTLECDFRRQSAGFISELMRMARVNHECVEIQEALRQFAVSASQARETDTEVFDKDKATNKNLRDKKRQRCLDDMLARLYQLKNCVNELILPRKRFYQDEARDEWEKLQYFIKYRLEIVTQYSSDMKIPPDLLRTAQVMIPRTERFTNWARKLLQQNLTENPYYLQPRGANESSTKEADQISEYVRLAETVVDLLRHIGHEYFRLCRQSMKSIFCECNPFAELRHTFLVLRSNLPHNKNDYAFPRIWPEKREKVNDNV